jgi:hypothetical protein
MRGYVNKLEFFSKTELIELRDKTLLNNIVIKHPNVVSCLDGLKRKYGLKKTTELCINLNILSEVEEKTLIAVRFLNLKEDEKIKTI